MKADTEIDSFHFDSPSCENITSERREIPLPPVDFLLLHLPSLLLGLFWQFHFDLGNRKHVLQCFSCNCCLSFQLQASRWQSSCFIKISKYKIGMKSQNNFPKERKICSPTEWILLRFIDSELFTGILTVLNDAYWIIIQNEK